MTCGGRACSLIEHETQTQTRLAGGVMKTPQAVPDPETPGQWKIIWHEKSLGRVSLEDAVSLQKAYIAASKPHPEPSQKD
jgi:hypothetical protein